MRIFTLFIVLTLTSCATSSIHKATVDAQIRKSDSLDTKIDKALRLLNEQHYFYPKGPPTKLPPPFDEPYHLDSMRSPEQILTQKIGGFCGSTALAFAAILNDAGVEDADMQVVEAVTNTDLKIICPKSATPRTAHPRTGASGHVFVAIRYQDNKWKIINTIDGSGHYGQSEWFNPSDLAKKMKTDPVAIPLTAYRNLPRELYAKGLTVFQSWKPSAVPLHTFEQRLDLIASGKMNSSDAKICRFTAPD